MCSKSFVDNSWLFSLSIEIESCTGYSSLGWHLWFLKVYRKFFFSVDSCSSIYFFCHIHFFSLINFVLYKGLTPGKGSHTWNCSGNVFSGVKTVKCNGHILVHQTLLLPLTVIFFFPKKKKIYLFLVILVGWANLYPLSC